MGAAVRQVAGPRIFCGADARWQLALMIRCATGNTYLFGRPNRRRRPEGWEGIARALPRSGRPAARRLAMPLHGRPAGQSVAVAHQPRVQRKQLPIAFHSHAGAIERERWRSSMLAVWLAPGIGQAGSHMSTW
jgi:hypothetical protein